MPRAAPHPVRMVTIGLLCMLAVFVLWRGLRLGWLAWQGIEAVQQLQADSSGSDATGGQAVPAERLPQLQHDLQALSERLAALDAELRPLAPAARALAGLPGYAGTIAGAPDLVASANRLAAAAAAMGPQLAWLLGIDAPRTYLLLVQNNHELRATGGFLSAFGTLVIDHGSIADLAFVDSYELFSTEHEYPPAPAPMQRYMGIQLLTARDANWSPDLRAGAETIRKLYLQATGQAVDGIVTLDLDAVRHLVRALDGVSVAGIPTPITAENVDHELIRLWEQPLEQAAGARAAGDWWAQRKDFVPLVASAALAKLQAGEFAASKLPAELTAALDGRSLQLWLDQPQLEQVLVEQGWDGGLHPPASSDFLAVVDTNVGYNKVDAAMQRRLQYGVTWPQGAGQKAEVTLTLTYTHSVVAEDPGCDPAPRYGERYADLIARCYFDYVRVYAPGGSELVDVSGIDPETVSSTAGEGPTQQFAGYFVLPPDNSKSITFTYRLPARIVPDGYRLHVQRQAGTDALPVRVVVNGVERTDTIEGGEWEW